MVIKIPEGTLRDSSVNRVAQHVWIPTEFYHTLVDRLIEERKRRPKLSFSAMLCELMKKGLDK